MLVVRTTKEEKKEGKMELPVPVKTEKPPELNQQALYLIISLMDLECSRGFRHAEMVKRKGGQLVLTDEANSISEDPSRIPMFIWDMKKIKAKAGESGAISNLWKSLSEEKKKIISFKGPDAEQNAKIAYEILRAAGFEEDMLKFASKRSIKILGLPENFDIEGLTARLAKNLERVKSDNAKVEAAETAQARAERQEEIKKDFANMFGNEDALSNPDLKAWKAAEMIRYVHDSASPSESMLYSVWFLLNKRPDFVQIVNELRAVEPYEPWLRPFSAMRKEEYVAMIKSMREEKPLGEARITPSGKEHEGLLAYEREGRGGKPSELERASALPWEIPQDFLQRLQKGEAVLFYTFPSAERYAEARATVEALFRGRAVSVEHTPEFNRGRDVGEWVMTVHRPGEKIDEGAKAAAGIRWKGAQADPSEKFSIQTNPFSRARGGKTEYISAEEAISDAVNNYSTYSTKFTADPEKMPEWFRTLVTYENYVDAEGKKQVRPLIRENVRKALLAKGVDINVEIAGITTSRWSRDVSYTFRLTISGENVRKPLQAARNEAKKNASEIPPLKRIAAFEGEGETYAARMRRLKEETDKLL